MFDSNRLKTDILALGLLALVVFCGLSFLSYDQADPPSNMVFPPRQVPTNIFGEVGAAFAFYSRQIFGLGIWAALAALVAWDLRLFSRQEERRVVPTLVGTLLLLGGMCCALHVLLPGVASGSPYGSGGMFGAWTGILLTEKFSQAGVVILSVSLLLAGWLMCPLSDLSRPVLRFASAPLSIVPTAVGTLRRTAAWKPRRSVVAVGPEPTENPDDGDTVPFRINQPVDETAEDSDQGVPHEETADGDRSIRINPPLTLSLHDPEPDEITEQPRSYSLPSVELLEHAEDFPYELLAKKARIAAATLEKTFEEFGLNIKVSEIDTGPVVTQFELELEPGLRVNKVTALEDDLAIALRVPSVRVVAPIPGKNTVGVEVPNEKQVMVRLKELLLASRAQWEDMRLPLFLGKDVSGRPLAVDMSKMPHLLIAGRTGTGKSVCLNTLILSLLMTRTPDEVRMLMIDPKMVELSPYKRIPHLMHPVITDMKKAEAVLAWAVDKMEERYDLLARVGVRHLESFNKLGKAKVMERLGLSPLDLEAENVPDHMPYIVIIADEMADLMMTSGKEVEASIIRLAQKSRAVGIHLVLATQKPTVDVITGLIKSNLPARVSFQVASRMDSRVVLDEGGAERLLGSGDMLYLAPGTSSLTRAQGTYVSDEEITAVIDFFSDMDPEYSQELARLTTANSNAGGSGGETGPRHHDDLYDDAVEVVIREGRGSVSLLQRALGIGYGRAARMIDYMAEDGIVGDYNGAQAREVLYTQEQWDDIRAQRQCGEE
ncbi:MAG: DNA translocase FtsK 4TM domain-containing protein [Planctomycetaceae bacterium]|nr:DNA translocase FtsK 4TM domain-containing protein [Planctomycetaceae bacterium]